MVRLNKYLADCGVASRRKCDEFIAAGKVSVNGAVEQRLGTKIEIGADEVRFLDKLIKPAARYEYILIHKPKDVITTAADERGRRTVLDIVKTKTRVFPVGRLDRDTTGALLLTSDGELAHRLMHPKFNIKKTYEAILNRDLVLNDARKLEDGIPLEEGVTGDCLVEFPVPADHRFVVLTIHQGWNRQIRRMFDTLGYDVVKLKRIAYAFLDLRGLRRGQWRHLNQKEVERLRTLGHGNSR